MGPPCSAAIPRSPANACNSFDLTRAKRYRHEWPGNVLRKMRASESGLSFWTVTTFGDWTGPRWKRHADEQWKKVRAYLSVKDFKRESPALTPHKQSRKLPRLRIPTNWLFPA